MPLISAAAKKQNLLLLSMIIGWIILFFLIKYYTPQMYDIIKNTPGISWLSIFIPSEEGLFLDIVAFLISSIPTIIVVYKQYLEDLF